MIPTIHALLICVVFLCGLEETVQSQRGHCAGNLCVALFQDPDEDYPGAQESCKDSGGELFMYDFEHVESIFGNPLLSGSYWLELPSANRSLEEAAAGLQKCPSISVSTGRNVSVLWELCHGTLDGFLCQYAFEEPCSRLQASDGAQVKYTTPLYFEVDDSETFPPGTIAVTEKVGGKYPDSKHVCFWSKWVRAPWNCEVLHGGCAHNCSSARTHTCVCPAGKTLHTNNITCIDGPCEENPCTGEGRECETTHGGGFKCTCKDGFVEEDGVCVNVTICEKCEHMLCDKFNGVYECVCRKGFKVSAHDPTKCEVICTERDCPGTCIKSDKQGRYQCFCPDGYIQDVHDATNSTPFCTDINECETEQCDHKCENLFGSYRCLCDQGFKLHHDGYTCEEEEDEYGSGSTPSPYPTPAGALPAGVPSYIKTGSILGITVFMALCTGLLFFLIRNAVKRCGKFELSSFKHPDIDIFYLQQVTTETYKRLSFDKQFKNDS